MSLKIRFALIDLGKRCSALENLYSTPFFLETLNLGKHFYSFTDLDLGRPAKKYGKSVAGWFSGVEVPTIEERCLVLDFVAKKMSWMMKTDFVGPDIAAALKAYDAILKGGQDPQGAVNPSELATGGSGE